MLPGAEPGRLAACLRFLFPHVLRFRRRTNRDKLLNNIDQTRNATSLNSIYIHCPVHVCVVIARISATAASSCVFFISLHICATQHAAARSRIMRPRAEPGRLAACLTFLFPQVRRFRRRTNRDKLLNNIDQKRNATSLNLISV